MNAIVDWFNEDLVRAGLTFCLLVSVVVIVLILRPSRDSRLPLWRGLLAVLWIAGVLGAGILTRLDPDLRFCKTSSVSSDTVDAVEKSSGPKGKLTGTTTTHTPETFQLTSVCEPLSIAEIAVLCLPFLILIAPILKGFNIAGLFGFDFREFKDTVVNDAANSAKEQVVRVIVSRDIGDKTQRAVAQSGEGDLSDLTELENLP